MALNSFSNFHRMKVPKQKLGGTPLGFVIVMGDNLIFVYMYIMHMYRYVINLTLPPDTFTSLLQHVTKLNM